MYAPVDASKGICRMSRDFVEATAMACEHFQAIKTCASCTNFVSPANGDNIGTCIGFEKEHWVSSDLKATTCEHYIPNDQTSSQV